MKLPLVISENGNGLPKDNHWQKCFALVKHKKSSQFTILFLDNPMISLVVSEIERVIKKNGWYGEKFELYGAGMISMNKQWERQTVNAYYPLASVGFEPVPLRELLEKLFPDAQEIIVADSQVLGIREITISKNQ